MKTRITVLLTILSLTTFAQFPEPTNLEFSFDYIMIDQSGYCAGQWVYGPTYCSHFNWTVPDTTSTTATLEYYNIYYYSYGTQDTTILASLTETFFDIELGIMGEVWVTAMYSNPEGESEPSNIIINEDLPISVPENNQNVKNLIRYDANSDFLLITNESNILKINIYNNQGKLVKSTKPINHKVRVNDLAKGLYIVEIMDNYELKRHKIIK
jgi:hypothetical protein